MAATVEAKEKVGPRVKPKVPTRAWIVGTLESCPIQNVHVAGICFPRFTNRLVPSKDRSWFTHSQDEPGDLIQLSDAKIAEILDRVEKKVVRWFPVDLTVWEEERKIAVNLGRPVPPKPQARAQLLSTAGTSNVPYEPGENDEGMENHLYLLPESELDAADMRAMRQGKKEPPSIAELKAAGRYDGWLGRKNDPAKEAKAK